MGETYYKRWREEREREEKGWIGEVIRAGVALKQKRDKRNRLDFQREVLLREVMKTRLLDNVELSSLFLDMYTRKWNGTLLVHWTIRENTYTYMLRNEFDRVEAALAFLIIFY